MARTLPLILAWLLVLGGTVAALAGAYALWVALGIYRIFGWDGATFAWIEFVAIALAGIVSVVIGVRALRRKGLRDR